MCTLKEYLSITMMHLSKEKDDIIENSQLLGAVLYIRGLGDYSLKFPSEFSTELFFKLLRGQQLQCYQDGIQYCNVMPPTHFIDLTELQLHKSTLVLYTHGVDAIVDGEATVSQRVKKLDGPDPSIIVGRLIGSQRLNHSVEVSWIGSDGNWAVELLGNLVAGTSVELFAKFLGPAEHGQRDDMMILQYELVPRI
ncbi:uncharacterized protein BT62DRAFT_1055213 [Guyanagaster necrorhizus]|uniref:Uncharacterized protein n=1 Tax=Guyanagaster necrorhizus TaxID=856835 RepID=A0A9P7VEV6_9AGAR|nr:uncharacterized protein BT62DRAFT_1055213 [Guyanagaster necrorhizus MCA 3950]KAG7439651.1 hypothetical protein BT62DRAFT_1055213 [Guyanagaster necrorhizus MCA 3950]